MAHHSSEVPLNEIDEFNEIRCSLNQRGLDIEVRLREKLGATGQFPEGKYSEHDEGEIQFAVAADATCEKVFIDFGTPIRSLGMTAEQAAELGEMLIKKSLECRGIAS
jgi:hypothetical protein